MEESNLQVEQGESSENITIVIGNGKFLPIEILPAAAEGSQPDAFDCQFVVQIPSCSEDIPSASSGKLDGEPGHLETAILIDGKNVIVADGEKPEMGKKETEELDERGMPVKTIWPMVDDNGIFYCTRCSYKTEKKQNWYKHKQTHSGTKRHQCPECGYLSASASNMKRHRLTHSDTRNYVCTVCQAQFRQKTHLQRHHDKAHVKRHLKCCGCSYMASTTDKLARHVARKHKKLLLLSSDATDDQQSYQMASKQYRCTHCSFTDLSRQVVQQHIKFHRAGTELKLYCTQCSFVTDCASRLQRHRLVHSKHKPFACQLCDYRANQREHVVRHLRCKHQLSVSGSSSCSGASGIVRRPVEKPLLVAAAPASATVVKDVETVTGNRLVLANPSEPVVSGCGDKLFACNFCSLQFGKLLSLYKHVHLQHADRTATMNQLNCVICDFSACHYKALLSHMRQHTASEEAKMAATASSDERCDSIVRLLQHSGASLASSNSVQKMLQLEDSELAVQVELPQHTTAIDTGEVEQQLMDEVRESGGQALTDLSAAQLTAVQSIDGIDLSGLMKREQIAEDELVVGEVSELASGDLIEINGETYQVQMS